MTPHPSCINGCREGMYQPPDFDIYICKACDWEINGLEWHNLTRHVREVYDAVN